MTFDDIKSIITDRLKIKSTDTDSVTRVERLINLVYREITAGLGMASSRRSTITADTSIGSALVTFTGVEKIERIFDETSGTVIVLEEITYMEMREIAPASSDSVTRWAIKSRTDDTITVQFDVEFTSVKQLDADVWATVSTLSGNDEPAFPSSFHDVLVHGVLVQEYLRSEKPTLADREDVKYNRRMSQLRNWNAITANQKLRQGQVETGVGAESSGASGAASSSYVTGAASSTDNAIVRFDGASGKSIQNSGITIADGASGTLSGTNSGDVTLAGTPDYITITGQVITRGEIQNDDIRDSAALSVIGRSADSTGDVADIAAGTDGHVLRRSGTTLAFGTIATAGIADEAVTYAKMQHVSAASRLLGRGSAAGAGDVEELTIGSGLSFAGTVLSATAVNTKPFLVFTAASNRPPASSYATPDTRNSRLVLDFDGGADEEAVFEGVLPTHYAGGGLTCEIFVAFTSATSGSVRFQAGIERIDASSLDIDSDSFASFQSAGGTAPGTSGQVIKVTITFTNGAQMDSLAAGEAFRLKIRRDADGTSGTDDIATDAEVLRVVLRET